ncbi:MAG: hypothetical protein SV062_07450, partial [Thermodesulfobacteriota bacterium]|nr:hypothetical protein [Thermodesulfobacteriota bacterium]
ISKDALYKLIQAGKLKRKKFETDRRTFLSKAELEAFFLKKNGYPVSELKRVVPVDPNKKEFFCPMCWEKHTMSRPKFIAHINKIHMAKNNHTVCFKSKRREETIKLAVEET